NPSVALRVHFLQPPVKRIQRPYVLLDYKDDRFAEVIQLPSCLCGSVLTEIVIDGGESNGMRILRLKANTDADSICRIAGPTNKTFVNAFLGLRSEVVMDTGQDNYELVSGIGGFRDHTHVIRGLRSEEHTSELQS